jgi:hypothetical protein
MRSLGRIAAPIVSVSVALWASLARAEETHARADESIRRANVDTTYGRLDGDLGIGVGLGATFGPGAPRGTVDVRLRYLETVGIYAEYEDGLGGDSNPRRVLASGLEIRPLFLARWLVGRETSSPWPDLFVDSFGLELGTFYEQPAIETVGNGLGLQAGLGLELPLLPHASGPWIGLHGGARWADPALGRETASLFLTVTLAYHQIFGAHVVDFADMAPR